MAGFWTRLGAGAALLGAVFAAPASANAGQMLEQISPDDIAVMLDEYGLAYSVEIDPRGYPMIQIDAGVLPAEQATVMFFACNEMTMGCEDITLWSWFEAPNKGAQTAINVWNDPFQGGRRWATGYLDEEGDPALTLNVNATGGIGETALRIMVNTFIEDMMAFSDILHGDQVADAANSSATPTMTAAFMDQEMIRLTRLLKEHGGDGFAYSKQSNKK